MPSVTFEISNEIASDIRSAVAKTPTPTELRERGANDQQVEVYTADRDLIRKLCQPGRLELDVDDARRTTASLGVAALGLMFGIRTQEDLDKYHRLHTFVINCGKTVWHAVDDDARREMVGKAIEYKNIPAVLLRHLLVNNYEATEEQLTAVFPDYA